MTGHAIWLSLTSKLVPSPALYFSIPTQNYKMKTSIIFSLLLFYSINSIFAILILRLVSSFNRHGTVMMLKPWIQLSNGSAQSGHSPLAYVISITKPQYWSVPKKTSLNNSKVTWLFSWKPSHAIWRHHCLCL